MTATLKTEAKIPEILGATIPLLNINPYTLTKSFYNTVVRPGAFALQPKYSQYVEPTLTKTVDYITPLIEPTVRNHILPNLSKVGFEGLKELTVDGKGNTIIQNGPENTKTVIVGGKAGELQDFDVFVARLVLTFEGLHLPLKEVEVGEENGVVAGVVLEEKEIIQ